MLKNKKKIYIFLSHYLLMRMPKYVVDSLRQENTERLNTVLECFNEPSRVYTWHICRCLKISTTRIAWKKNRHCITTFHRVKAWYKIQLIGCIARTAARQWVFSSYIRYLCLRNRKSQNHKLLPKNDTCILLASGIWLATKLSSALLSSQNI